MNYYYFCPHCSHEHIIPVEVAKGSLVEAAVPLYCPFCGLKWDVDKILDDIAIFVEDNFKTYKQPDNRSDDK